MSFLRTLQDKEAGIVRRQDAEKRKEVRSVVDILLDPFFIISCCFGLSKGTFKKISRKIEILYFINITPF